MNDPFSERQEAFPMDFEPVSELLKEEPDCVTAL